MSGVDDSDNDRSEYDIDAELDQEIDADQAEENIACEIPGARGPLGERFPEEKRESQKEEAGIYNGGRERGEKDAEREIPF